jgi:hypothetical protein
MASPGRRVVGVVHGFSPWPTGCGAKPTSRARLLCLPFGTNVRRIMTATPPTPSSRPPPRFEVIVPDALSAGVYSNAQLSWFNRTDFTVDFAVHLPVEPRTDDTGPYLHSPVQVVSRVKIPPSMVFRLIQNLETTMTQYEQMFGPITHLGDEGPLLPPDDFSPGQGGEDG